jgi:hypothetical protein
MMQCEALHGINKGFYIMFGAFAIREGSAVIYVKSVLGGFIALLLTFVLVFIWISRWASRLAPKGGTVGFAPVHLLLPRALLVESAIFMAGFGVVWMLLRHR